MPIYEYRCEACGFSKDHLQKLSDPLLTECPECHADAYKKQLSAAGFVLKGSGWYQTDFKSNKTSTPSTSDSSAKTTESSTSTNTTETATSSHSCGSGPCGQCS